MTLPQGLGRGAILHVPAFAEEQNKSGRMVALAAQAFAARGWAVLQFDLLGCGDSAGDSADATWQQWVEDVGLAYGLLRARCRGPVILWTHRAGSLLASDWLQITRERLPLLMWQPVTNGRQHLSQFLRLKAASEMLSDADAKAALGDIRAALRAGEAVEVAGYGLSPALAAGMEASSFELVIPYECAVAMLEVQRKRAQRTFARVCCTTSAARGAVRGSLCEQGSGACILADPGDRDRARPGRAFL